jgi:flagellar hook-associated protein 3 FlgL
MTTIDGPMSNQAGLLGVLIGRSADIRSRLDRVNAQAGTGLVSEDYSGLGGQAAITLDLRPRLASIDAWRGNIDAAATRMNVARTAMGGIERIAADLRARLADLNGLNPASIDAVAAEARLSLARVADLLNSQAAGAYVFAGEDSGNPPVPDADAITSSGFFTTIQTAVSALSANGVPATLAATLAAGASNTAGVSPFSEYLSRSASALAAPAAETGPGQRVRTGLLASANGVAVSQGSSSTGSHMRDLMRALATVGSLSSTQADAAELPGLVSDLRTVLTGAIDAMAVDVGAMGDTEADLATMRTRLDETETALTGQISRIEDVDMAKTLSRLSQLEAQLQVSYRLLSGSNNLSLVKFLGST